MHQVLHSFLNKFVVAYFDDILVYSRNEEDYLEHLKLVFEALKKNELYINTKKCTFCIGRISFLGFIISNNQIKMDEPKVEAVTNWQIPDSTKAVQAFIGLTSFYRKFIKNFSSITTPITDCLKKGGFSWGKS